MHSYKHGIYFSVFILTRHLKFMLSKLTQNFYLPTLCINHVPCLSNSFVRVAWLSTGGSTPHKRVAFRQHVLAGPIGQYIMRNVLILCVSLGTQEIWLTKAMANSIWCYSVGVRATLHPFTITPTLTASWKCWRGRSERCDLIGQRKTTVRRQTLRVNNWTKKAPPCWNWIKSVTSTVSWFCFSIFKIWICSIFISHGVLSQKSL